MKYIRTKDGRIIDINSEYVGHNITFTMFFMGNEKLEVVKSADTIEELCDQLFYVKDTIPTDIYPPLINPKGIIECQIELGCTEIYKLENFKYGIWTKNGLKYVAEFDEKGELELL